MRLYRIINIIILNYIYIYIYAVATLGIFLRVFLKFFFLVERSKGQSHHQVDESWVSGFFIKYLSIILVKE